MRYEEKVRRKLYEVEGVMALNQSKDYIEYPVVVKKSKKKATPAPKLEQPPKKLKKPPPPLSAKKSCVKQKPPSAVYVKPENDVFIEAEQLRELERDMELVITNNVGGGKSSKPLQKKKKKKKQDSENEYGSSDVASFSDLND